MPRGGAACAAPRAAAVSRMFFEAQRAVSLQAVDRRRNALVQKATDSPGALNASRRRVRTSVPARRDGVWRMNCRERASPFTLRPPPRQAGCGHDLPARVSPSGLLATKCSCSPLAPATSTEHLSVLLGIGLSGLPTCAVGGAIRSPCPAKTSVGIPSADQATRAARTYVYSRAPPRAHFDEATP